MKLIAIPLLLAGCAKGTAPASPGDSFDPIPLVIFALDGAAIMADAARDDSLETYDYLGCLVSVGAGSALRSASEGVKGNLGGGRIPSIEIDIAPCMPLAESSPEGLEISGSVGAAVDVAVGGAGTLIEAYKGRMPCETYAWSSAAIDYTYGVADAVLAFVVDPASVAILVPAVDVDLEVCE